MKITRTNKKLEESTKEYTRVIVDEKGAERLVQKNKVDELHVISGKFDEVTPRTFRILLRSIIQAAKKYKCNKIALELSLTPFKKLTEYGDNWVVCTIAKELHVADYSFNHYKSKKESSLNEVLICGGMKKSEAESFKKGEVIAKYINRVRDIANTPGGDMTPELLAEASKKALTGTRAKVTVLGLTDIKKLKMGGLLGVGKGAKDTPRFIVIEYKGSANKSEKPIVFVGKGITFDTGGLQVKPGMSMYEMHMDMSGGAAVIGALGAIAELGLKKHVIGLIPAAENAVSDEAIRPGDIITMMSGKSVEVLHTDAEGRLVLADALHYAKRYHPKLVVDIATLTGAALVALGQHAHAIMTKDRELEDTLRELGEQSGDYISPLPLWDEYKQYTKGTHADITNIPSNDTRNGGAINGGTFLSHFTDNYRWAHIDMAPRMTSVASDKLAKGATGEPTSLLVSIAEHF